MVWTTAHFPGSCLLITSILDILSHRMSARLHINESSLQSMNPNYEFGNCWQPKELLANENWHYSIERPSPKFIPSGTARYVENAYIKRGFFVRPALSRKGDCTWSAEPVCCRELLQLWKRLINKPMHHRLRKTDCEEMQVTRDDCSVSPLFDTSETEGRKLSPHSQEHRDLMMQCL